jgi:3-hydroxybutyryl-CoA dehydrogenase
MQKWMSRSWIKILKLSKRALRSWVSTNQVVDVDSLLGKDVQKEKLTSTQSQEIRSRILPTTEISPSTLSPLDFIIEAVSENPSLKDTIFKQLASECAPHAILASNTSSIGITRIAAAASGAQDRVIGMHFMVRREMPLT